MSGRAWRNWAGGQACTPASVARPTSQDELAEIVATAARRGQPVRAVGSGHSFTDCACTDGVMIDMAGLQRVRAADPVSGLVTIEGGATLRSLGGRLAASGLGLANQGDIDAQTITGATATATHGTGARFPNLSAQLVSLRLVTADGEAVDVDGGDDYLAARVSLGALGVISEVTVQAVPLYALHRRDEPRPLAETLDRLDELVDDNDHFEFFLFPYTETALTRTTARSVAEPTPTAAWKRRMHAGVENTGMDLICRVGRRLPATVPRLNQLITAMMTPATVSDHAYKVYATERKVKFTEMEYAIPRRHAREALERVVAMIRRHRWPILFPIEVRFAAGDDALLSTAHERETCYIAVHQYRGMDFEEFFRSVEQIMDDYAGRPHWGKYHFQTAETLRNRYPGFDRFTAVRDRFDPQRVFANDYTRRVLGP
ncbi:FAD-binding protein [Mycobacterium koreense]|uniref:Oxidoreductase n=1 Tax=Mycolicibacillus koreensis TaxID=1069220 RepID=A0A7I7SD90_9MYCO|nr:D-arabinono-1,4-lactone oxidase [Mycolicibacillus koreensis]MCV7250243.1 FAD-binding protein [Mycolicibacillus koreensis]ODR11129.1 oxidoreductase [Mycolicibacillus koreensis]OSC32635.1 oxidoreductase [Mycolicibacillus koreensis]BBY54892.1 L-gulono-1,4-lactone dehydrogenase [Mycolicibacillus koreensis]